MKTTLLLIPIFIAYLAVGQQLTPGERQFAINYLTATENQLLAETSKIPEDRWFDRPSENAWSPAECMEHILLSEAFIYDNIKRLLTTKPENPVDPAIKLNDGLIISWTTDRVKRIQTIEPLKPSGRWKTKSEMVNSFMESRKELREFIKTTDKELRSVSGPTPVGEADGFQLLLTIGGHG